MNKRQDIELLRIISTFSIVWFHTGVIGHEISYSGLIVFLILSMYLSGKGNTFDGLRIAQRTRRLLIPWAVWFIIYGAKNIFANKSIIPTDHGIISGILSGPSIHLWYMPFIFACLLVFEIIKKHVSAVSIAQVSALLTMLILATTTLWRSESIQLGYPVEQYAHASGGIALGAFFLYFDALTENSRRFFLALIIASALTALPSAGVGIPYLIGIVSGCILVFEPFGKTQIQYLNGISQLTLGIYFVHPLVIRGIHRTIPIAGISLPVTAFLVSALIILIGHRASPKLAKYWT